MKIFNTIRTFTTDVNDFELVEHIETKALAIRIVHRNQAGHISRSCPTIWVEDVPDLIMASFKLLCGEADS